MKKIIITFISLIVIIACNIGLVSCQKNESEEHTLVGKWKMDSISYTFTDDARSLGTSAYNALQKMAKDIYDDWVESETFFRITENMLLYCDDKNHNEWPPYILTIDDDQNGNVKKINAKGHPDYIKLLLTWNVEEDEIICLFVQAGAIFKVNMSKVKD